MFFLINPDDLDDYEEIISRIIVFFAPLFQWLLKSMGFKYASPIEDEPIKAIKTPVQMYAEKYNSAFMASFLDANSHDWNANVDAVIRDQKALTELLEDPNNEIEKKWKRSVLIEATPRGNVFMFYDAYKQAFSYYCDQSLMPYEIMNSVAMKYVLTFHCREFFVDSNVLKLRDTPTTPSETPPTENAPHQKPKKVELSNSFAKFKSYNTSSKKVTLSKEDDKIINRFVHLGPVRNWTPGLKRQKENPLNGFKTDMGPSNAKLSYQDYKNMKQKS